MPPCCMFKSVQVGHLPNERFFQGYVGLLAACQHAMALHPSQGTTVLAAERQQTVTALTQQHEIDGAWFRVSSCSLVS